MKVLIIGNGGREHAIGWKLSQDKRITQLYFAPGNGGTESIGINVPIAVTDTEGLLKFTNEQNIDMTVVGPELPLTCGVVDAFEKAGKKIFGPNSAAAMLEGSKAYAKQFMKKHNIPTAKYETFDSVDEAVKSLENAKYPIVIKADGLAAGKGVVICQSKEDATEQLNAMLIDRVFGEAGCKVVIEQFLQGKEVSVLAFVDGNCIIPMVSAQDYKRAHDGDGGLNTGGMGSVSPALHFTKANEQRFENEILARTLEGIKAENLNFKGILFFGLMVDGDDVNVIEFNVRFGDPETETVLLRLKTPLLDIFEAVIDNNLNDVSIEWHDEPAVCVVLASGGYPGSYEVGKTITAEQSDGIQIFHAGTTIKDNTLVTNGGRVLVVSAMGQTIEKARTDVYNACRKINFDGAFYRTDIAKIN